MKRSSISQLQTASLVLLFTLGQVPWSASGAESAAPSDEYNEHVEAGNRLSADKNYAAALKEFETAYGISPRPRLLINLGRCLYRLGRARDALSKYEQFERAETNADTETQLRLAKFKEDALRAIVSGSTSSANPDDPSAGLRRPDGSQAGQSTSSAGMPPKGAIVLMSVGGATLLVGLGLGLGAIIDASRIGDSQNQNQVFNTSFQQIDSRGRALGISSIALDVAGPLALAAGAIWSLARRSAKPKPKIEIETKVSHLPRVGHWAFADGY